MNRVAENEALNKGGMNEGENSGKLLLKRRFHLHLEDSDLPLSLFSACGP